MTNSTPPQDGEEHAQKLEQLDDALDTLASMLRTFGRHSFAVGDPNDEIFEQQCEAWARHLLTGSPAERQHDGNTERDENTADPEDREWTKLREFIRARRRCECTYVEQLATELRETILVLVEGLREVEMAQNATSLSVHQHLTRLEKSESPAELRDFAKQTVVALRKAIGVQHERLISQLGAVGERLRKVADDLYGAPHPEELDAVTQLYTGPAFEQALRQHVDLSSLMNLPLTLIICRVDNPLSVPGNDPTSISDGGYRTLSDCIARSFFRKRDILGRLSENEFAAAILEVPKDELEQMLDALLRRFQSADVMASNPPSPLRHTIVAAPLMPAENSVSLLGRAREALSSENASGNIAVIT